MAFRETFCKWKLRLVQRLVRENSCRISWMSRRLVQWLVREHSCRISLMSRRLVQWLVRENSSWISRMSPRILSLKLRVSWNSTFSAMFDYWHNSKSEYYGRLAFLTGYSFDSWSYNGFFCWSNLINFEGFGHLGIDIATLWEQFPTFRRNVVTSSQGSGGPRWISFALQCLAGCVNISFTPSLRTAGWLHSFRGP